ncbi:MAG: hypothetical protein WKG07_26390 [Hymenobacter sp.]
MLAEVIAGKALTARAVLGFWPANTVGLRHYRDLRRR